LLAALAVTAAISLAGCGIQPLYGTTAGGSRLAAAMAGVDVTPIPGRVGQRVRNELIFENTGGSGQTGTTYKLDIVIKESVTNQLVEISGDAKSQVYQLDATFKLISNDGRVVLEGKATSRAPYERFETIFSNVRARYDAENRAARTVAESIKVRIAGYLSQSA
jgi:LPS-assembly lipoprotein